MNTHIIRAPQLGEGLKELKVISFLKQPGEAVEKDQPVLLVETEKATIEIESPVSGIVQELKVAASDYVLVGADLMIIQVGAVTSQAVYTPPVKLNRSGDVRSFGRRENYTDIPVSAKQQTLIRNMAASQKQIIPAFIQMPLSGLNIREFRRTYRREVAGALVPSFTEIVCWGVLQAMKKHERFRSALLEEGGVIRQHNDASIGIAVGLPNDELSIMRISETEFDCFDGFSSLYKGRLAKVRAGFECEGAHSVSISDLTSFHVQSAVPVVVAPAVATLCIGKALQSSEKNEYVLSLSFDHRIINGVGASRFLGEVKKIIEHLKPESLINRDLTQIRAVA